MVYKVDLIQLDMAATLMLYGKTVCVYVFIYSRPGQNFGMKKQFDLFVETITHYLPQEYKSAEEVSQFSV